MVFARTSKAASRLSEQIRTRTFYKAYLAVLHGIPEKKEGELWDFLLKDSRTNTVKTVQEGTAGSKEAILEYRLLDTRENLSLVKIHLHTGRPHQIRVQFSSRGYPLYGDQRYGGKMTKPGQQLALWSAEIRCMHPTRKEEMTFRCPPPDTYPWNLFR